MSAESVQAYVNWVKQSGGINSQAARQLNSITSQLNALNPGNPNSTAQLSALQKQAQAIVNSRDSQIAALGRPPNPANLTERELAQVGALIGLNAGNGLIDYRNALDSLQSAGAAAQKNIGTTRSADTSRGQTTPVTTGDGTSKPVTNVAASANTTTRTTVTANANAATTTATISKPPPIAVVSDSARDIVINTAPITVPTIDVKTGKTTGNTTINLAPITIPGEKLALPPAETGNTAPAAGPPAAGLTAGITTAAGGASAQDLANFTARADWRVRLALAPESKYLYNNQNNAGILAPLQKTDGVIFPYTPAINVSYAAQYDPTKLTHSNYTMFQYSSSSVDSVSITCDFTAQDVFEANYMLAVIHFFRSMTKMFYGQDSDPKNGTPPPLCYLYGLGGFQFDALPLAINGFNYVLPQDVDYIKTTGPTVSVNAPATSPSSNSITNVIASFQRLGKALKPGGKAAAPNYENTPVQNSDTTTWVPTKINLSISCVPIMSRNAVSNRFSLTEYANGTLLRGTRDGAQGGGFW